jgi:hypothetical protein
MTATQQPAADPVPEQLTFEGYDVVGHSFSITGEVDGGGPPMEYQETRWLFVKVKCDKVTHKQASKENLLPVRVHGLSVVHARPLEHGEVLAMMAGRQQDLDVAGEEGSG